MPPTLRTPISTAPTSLKQYNNTCIWSVWAPPYDVERYLGAPLHSYNGNGRGGGAMWDACPPFTCHQRDQLARQMVPEVLCDGRLAHWPARGFALGTTSIATQGITSGPGHRAMTQLQQWTDLPRWRAALQLCMPTVLETGQSATRIADRGDHQKRC